MSITTHPTTTATAETAPPGPVAAPSAPVVRPLRDATAVTAWARYVEAAPGGTIFHHPDWCQSVARVFRHRPQHLWATRNGDITGVLPLMEVNSHLGGRMLVSVPYGTYGGILADDDEIAAALARAAAELAVRRAARVLELRSAVAGAPDFEPVTGYLGFTRELPSSPGEVPGILPKRARAAARHARDRAGVTVRHGHDQLRLTWELYCRSMRRLGSINYPYRFFTQLRDCLGPRAWVSVAWLDDQPVCGTISLVFGDTVTPYVIGADERIRCDGAANWLYWNVMERAVQNGLRRFDFGRSRADNKGAAGFKKNQGFQPVALEYQRFVPPGRRPPDLKPSNPRFAAARRLWTKLPLPVTRTLGVWLSKSIPG